MIHPTTKKALTLSEGRAQLVDKRTPKKPRPEVEVDLKVKDYKFFNKGTFAWNLKELPAADSFAMLDVTRHDTKVNYKLLAAST